MIADASGDGKKPLPLVELQLQSLPPVIDLMTAARVLDLGRTKAYELARRGEFPCAVLRLGTRYRVVTADLFRLLGISDGYGSTGGSGDPSGGAAQAG